MVKVRNNLHNAVFRPRQTAPSLLPRSSLSPPGTGHQPERTRARDLFFQDGRPLSTCRAYRTSNERREEDWTREGTYTHGQSARSSQGGQILSFRNKIIFRVRGPDLDESSQSDASLSCCCWMHSRTDWQTCESPPRRRPRAISAYPGDQGISRSGCTVGSKSSWVGDAAFEPKPSLSAQRNRMIVNGIGEVGDPVELSDCLVTRGPRTNS